MRDSFLEITIVSGERIQLVKFLSSLPYTGLLEGKIVPRLNKIVLESHTFYLKKLWPDMPFVLLNEVELTQIESDILPEIRFIGEFRVCESDSDATLSGFIAIWFQNEPNPVISSENLDCLKKMRLAQVLRKRVGPS